jgi:NAD-dependent SIR2 family protein deacetylase
VSVTSTREIVCHARACSTNPEAFYTLAAEMLPGMHKPTPTHYFLRLLAEKKVCVTLLRAVNASVRADRCPVQVLRRIFTQNIDTLEQVAGIDPSLVVEAHGSFATAHCIDCRVEVCVSKVSAEVSHAHAHRCLSKLCAQRVPRVQWRAAASVLAHSSSQT